MNVRPLLAEGRLRPVTARAHGAAITAELALERMADRLTRSTGNGAHLGELTVLVKTFERPRVLRRLVDSIRRFYPEVPVVVVDDSREPQPIEGVETIAMSYDSGLCAGRNEALRHASTRYVLVLDDDFVFYRHTRLGHALAAMEALYPTSAVLRAPLGSSIGDFTVAAKVPNFFIARAASAWHSFRGTRGPSGAATWTSSRVHWGF